jgi:Lrp/AsnC family leucine-responsive transcriptional regulator
MDEPLDRLDLRLLQELQKDGRLTNNELGERIALSPSQCSRRRTRLEAEGYIRSYRAYLDRQRLGLDMLVVISVTLATHNRDNARRFSQLINGLPEVLEAYALTGEMDYHLTVATRGLDRPLQIRQRRAVAARVGAAREDIDRARHAEDIRGLSGADAGTLMATTRH